MTDATAGNQPLIFRLFRTNIFFSFSYQEVSPKHPKGYKSQHSPCPGPGSVLGIWFQDSSTIFPSVDQGRRSSTTVGLRIDCQGNCSIRLLQVCDLLFPYSRPPVKVAEPWVKGVPLNRLLWKVAYLHFIQLFFMGFILSLHLGHNSLLFHPDWLSVMRFLFQLLWDCGSSCFFCPPSDGGGKEAGVSCLMEGTGSGKSWALLWSAGPCSVKLSTNYLLMGRVALSLCQLFGLRPPNPGVYGRVNGNLQEGLCQEGWTFKDCCRQCPHPHAEPCDPRLHGRPSNTSRWFWFRVLWGHCSFPLGLGAYNILFVPSKTGVSVAPSPVEVL